MRYVYLMVLLVFSGCAKPVTYSPDEVDPAQLKKMLKDLTGLGYRHFYNPEILEKSAFFIRDTWQAMGLDVSMQSYEFQGQNLHNVIARFGPKEGPLIVVGAHYDVEGEIDGADDNGSGVVGLLELGRLLHGSGVQLKHRVELVAFTLEEQPFFRTPYMGSEHYATSLREQNTDVALMISLEMIGYFSSKKGSQTVPEQLKGLLPDVGNFICVVGRDQEKAMAEKVVASMKSGATIPVATLIADPKLPGIDQSDHQSFWSNNYPALMVTDTSYYRNKHYHKKSDKIKTLDLKSMAQVIQGLHKTLLDF